MKRFLIGYGIGVLLILLGGFALQFFWAGPKNDGHSNDRSALAKNSSKKQNNKSKSKDNGEIETGLALPPRYFDPQVLKHNNKLALLVGCTKYVNADKLANLRGPANDVQIWTDFLSDPQGFAFSKQNILQLVGWPRDHNQRPTYSNIAKAFRRLIELSTKDTQVVIMMSGHGMQIPLVQGDESEAFEDDGLDEVFLPSDVGMYSSQHGLRNAISDNQFRKWLNQLQQKGAHVLVIFDCCHSGHMTRNGPGIREFARVANPAALGITAHDLDQSISRAKNSNHSRAVTPLRSTKGSLVAFYASQQFETAPELPFPEGADVRSENYYGLLSWTMIKTLKSRKSIMTYQQLLRLLASNYRAQRGTCPPTPYADGNLNREILGLKTWPMKSILYVNQNSKTGLTLEAGLLHGITVGTILQVNPPVDAQSNRTSELGYLKVTSATALRSTVVPVSRQRIQGSTLWVDDPTGLQDIPEHCRCEVVYQDFGDLRVRVYCNDNDVKSAIGSMNKRIQGMMKLETQEQNAQWILKKIRPDQLGGDHQIAGKKESVFVLIQGQGQIRDLSESKNESPKIFAHYRATNNDLVIGLERDIPKIFKWQNLWRITQAVHQFDGGQDQGITLQIHQLKQSSDKSGRPIKPGEQIQNGQQLLWSISNSGQAPMWVTAFYLDANLGIQIIYSAGVANNGKPFEIARPEADTLNGKSTGLEGLVVFAIPQAGHDKPDFSILEQQPLAVAEAVSRSPLTGPTLSPFDRLLNYAAYHAGVRAPVVPKLDRQTPTIITTSWHLTP